MTIRGPGVFNGRFVSPSGTWRASGTAGALGDAGTLFASLSVKLGKSAAAGGRGVDQAGDGREGVAVVAMREPGLQRRGQNQRPGGGSGRGREDADDMLREVRELKERAVEVAQRLTTGARAAREQVMQQAAEVT